MQKIKMARKGWEIVTYEWAKIQLSTQSKMTNVMTISLIQAPSNALRSDRADMSRQGETLPIKVTILTTTLFIW